MLKVMKDNLFVQKIVRNCIEMLYRKIVYRNFFFNLKIVKQITKANQLAFKFK